MDASSAPPHAPTGRWGNLVVLTLVGGAAFWLANFAISLTPIAADYRAGLSISYVPMLLEALVGGLTLACGVSVVVVRFPDRVPGSDPLTRSVLMSVLLFVIVTVAIEIPAKLFGGIPDAVRYFVTGTMFNAIRILAMGVAIGAVARRGDRRRQSAPAPKPTHP